MQRTANDTSGWRRGVSRRRLLAGVGFSSAGLLAAAAAGCSTSGNAKHNAAPAGANTASVQGGTAAAKQQPRRGGTLTRRSVSLAYAGGMDPHIQQPSQTGEMGFFYQLLVRLNPTTTALESELAQKWEQPSPTEYLLHLAPNVKWHNKPPASGRLFTADDAIFSVNRLRGSDPKFINRTLLDSVDKVDAPDKGTLHLTTKLADASVLNNLASLSMVMLAPEVVDKAGKFATADAVVGTGAFILQSRDDTAAAMVRNPDYWKPGLPYLDGVKMQVIKDDTAGWAAFLAGQVDIQYVPGTDAKKIVADQTKPYNTAWYNDVGFVGIQANLKVKPFDDARVTRALRLLINHQEIMSAWGEVYFGRGAMSYWMPVALQDWDFTQQEYESKFLEFKTPKDAAIKESLAQLSAAGFTKDSPLKFTLSAQQSDQAFTRAQDELCQAQLNQNSQGVVKADLNITDEPHMRENLVNRNFAYVVTNLVPGQPYEPDSWFRTFFYTNGSRNYGSYSDPQLDPLIDKQRGLFDVNQRKTVVKDVLSYMLDHAPYTSWAPRYTPNAYQKKVQNFAPEGNSAVWGYNYEQVWFSA